MGTIADLIYSQMAQAGKPRTTTQQSTATTTAKANSPLDIGSLALLLYFMLSGQNKTSLQRTPAPAGTDLTSLIAQAPATLQSTPYNAFTSGQQNPLDLLIRLFGGTGGLGGSSGLR